MTPRTRNILLNAVVLLAVLQLFPGERKNDWVTDEIEAPPKVQKILERACYNCHSYATRWPWYSRIVPVSWFIIHDVNEGRHELNFSEWTHYSKKKRRKKRREITKQLSKGEMPPWYYTLMHSEAELSKGDHDTLTHWARRHRGKKRR